MGLLTVLVLLLQDPKVGQQAPAIKGHDYKSKKAVALAVGKPETLKEHASALEDAYKKYQDKLAFVAISFGKFDGLTFPIVVDEGKSKYAEGLYVIDITGKLVWKSKTFAFDDWRKEIEKATAPPQAKKPETPSTSRGSGGPTTAGVQKTPKNLPFELIPPSANGGPVPVLIVFSGVEGKQTMAQNLRQMASSMSNHAIAVLDGREAKASDGVDVLAQLRQWYNVDNDAIKVFTESAGTREGLTFALQLAQNDIAAVWANDPVAVVTPSSAPSYKPQGSAGCGAKAPRDVQNANAIVAGMKEKNYLTKEPFVDPNSGHGTTQGFMEGLKFLKDKRRR